MSAILLSCALLTPSIVHAAAFTVPPANINSNAINAGATSRNNNNARTQSHHRNQQHSRYNLSPLSQLANLGSQKFDSIQKPSSRSAATSSNSKSSSSLHLLPPDMELSELSEHMSALSSYGFSSTLTASTALFFLEESPLTRLLRMMHFTYDMLLSVTGIGIINGIFHPTEPIDLLNVGHKYNRFGPAQLGSVDHTLVPQSVMGNIKDDVLSDQVLINEEKVLIPPYFASISDDANTALLSSGDLALYAPTDFIKPAFEHASVGSGGDLALDVRNLFVKPTFEYRPSKTDYISSLQKSIPSLNGLMNIDGITKMQNGNKNGTDQNDGLEVDDQEKNDSQVDANNGMGDINGDSPSDEVIINGERVLLPPLSSPSSSSSTEEFALNDRSKEEEYLNSDRAVLIGSDDNYSHNIDYDLQRELQDIHSILNVNLTIEESIEKFSKGLTKREENEQRLAVEALAKEEEERLDAISRTEKEDLAAEALAWKEWEEHLAAEASAEKERLDCEAIAEKERLDADASAEKEWAEHFAAEALVEKEEEDRLAADALAEKKQLAAETLAEEERLACEGLVEKERLACERMARKEEEERVASELLAAEAFVIAEEEERLAAEVRAISEEEERIAAEALATSEEEERLAAEAHAIAEEGERLAAETLATEEEEKRLAAEVLAAEAFAIKETERVAAEAYAIEEEERVAAEAFALEEEERAAAEALAKKERLEAEAFTKWEEEARVAAEQIAAEIFAIEEKGRVAAEALAEKERLEAEAFSKWEEEERVAAEQHAAEIFAIEEEHRIAAEALARREEEERFAAEAFAIENQEKRQYAEAFAIKEEEERLAAEVLVQEAPQEVAFANEVNQDEMYPDYEPIPAETSTFATPASEFEGREYTTDSDEFAVDNASQGNRKVTIPSESENNKLDYDYDEILLRHEELQRKLTMNDAEQEEDIEQEHIAPINEEQAWTEIVTTPDDVSEDVFTMAQGLAKAAFHAELQKKAAKEKHSGTGENKAQVESDMAMVRDYVNRKSVMTNVASAQGASESLAASELLRKLAEKERHRKVPSVSRLDSRLKGPSPLTQKVNKEQPLVRLEDISEEDDDNDTSVERGDDEFSIDDKTIETHETRSLQQVGKKKRSTFTLAKKRSVIATAAALVIGRRLLSLWIGFL